MTEADIIVVGGGPAGSTCAWKLREAGRDVLVLDKLDFPRSKPCAGWITPRVLHDLQIDPRTYPCSLTRFDHLWFHLRRVPLPLPTDQYAIRRIEFDDWLLRRANVPTHRVTVTDIRHDAGSFIINDAYRCRILVGAGGTHCPVYRHLFSELRPRSEEFQIAALESEYAVDVREKRCHLWFPGDLPGYSWYVPKSNGYLNIGVGGKNLLLHKGGKTIREQWEKLVDSLEKVSYLSASPAQPQGHLYFLRHGEGPVQHGNAYILGDAAALATKDMGEGIGPAVRSGILAAEAIIRGTEYSVASIPAFSLPDLLFPHRH